MTASDADTLSDRSREDWLALVQKTLKTGDANRLAYRTRDGLSIDPLHRPAAPTRLARNASLDPERPWDIRTRVRHRDPAQANAQALTDLRNGAASLLLAVEPGAIAATLDNVLVGFAPVALDLGERGVEGAEALAEVARGLAAAPLAFHLDPLGVAARRGASAGASLDTDLDVATNAALRIAEAFDVATLFLANGRVAHEAGGSDAQELALALSSALAYAKTLANGGMPVEAAFRRIVLSLAADAEPIPTVAKFRAARLLWSRMVAACGADAPAVIEARSSRRMLSTLDPWTNLLRLTAAGFGAAVGGADAVVLGAFTDALGEPTDFARRQARNTQLVLMEEANLGRVSDPAAGAGLVEALTDQLARAAWRAFQAIEAEGGAVAALQSGRFAVEVAAAREAQSRALATRRTPLVGVSEYADLGGAPVSFEDGDPAEAVAAADKPAFAALTPVRWSEPFERLRARAADAGKGRVGLALLGPAAEHSARAGFARGLFAAGGIAAVELPQGKVAPLTVLCGSDERYAVEAADAARTARQAGAAEVWLAGRGGDNEAALRAAGVDRFIYAGCDAVEALDAALTVGA